MSLCACVIQVCRKYVNGSSGVIRVCTSVSGHRHRGGCVDTCRSVWYLHCVYTGREECVGHTARDSHCPEHCHGARCVCLPPLRAAGLEVDGNPSSPSCPQGCECWSMWAAAVTGRVGARRPAPASPGEHARQNPPLSQPTLRPRPRSAPRRAAMAPPDGNAGPPSCRVCAADPPLTP